MSSSRDTRNARLTQGLTRTQSPVHLFYPPDSTGRRPSEWANLQFASPAERAYYRAMAAESSHNINPSGPSREHAHATFTQQQHSFPNRTTQSLSSTMLPNYGIQGRGSSTSSMNPDGPSRPSRPRPRVVRYWYCCRPGCPDPGPYLSGVYADCALGCHRERCVNCREVQVSPYEQAPTSRRA